ncbi:MAG TPA: hypothetical protein VIW28_06935 [Gemmatimonadales bacterium]|jgi:hypothetical protein
MSVALHADRLRVGDTVSIEVRQPTGPWRTRVAVTGYERPIVTIEELRESTERQRLLRDQWRGGAP